ncbi:MAG: hypothetical protein ACXAEN_23835 [Candidatus Thorarchaeota archaeon]|jgi:hypothetical protein
MPKFQHDCNGCEFLGTVTVPQFFVDGRVEMREADCYVCRPGRLRNLEIGIQRTVARVGYYVSGRLRNLESKTARTEWHDLIARYGDEPSNYASGNLEHTTLLADAGILLAAQLYLNTLGVKGAGGKGFHYTLKDGTRLQTGWED